ncbi:hypothetical protein C2W62_01060 [Candidatus Entotheonella serta]|nr:hypothetical protein C2W62_01060 [Candidatus Entotheonella serta]
MPADLQFYHVQTLNHNGTVVVFGESKGASANNSDREHKLWYRVLDLEQISDENSPNVWDDNTRWTDWMEIPYPDELRNVAQSLLTVRQTVGDAVHDHLHHWRVISDDENIFLFRALDLAAALGRGASPSLSQNGAAPAPLESEATQIRIYANRYALIRDASPAGGTNRAASGKEVTVPQLKLRSESRYRRSGMRETPTSDIDGQGYLDMGDQPFREPTMEFSMLAPLEGLFTVTLAPASIPQRRRWQFFVKAPDRHIAAYSLLRDEDGWFDAEEKYDQFNLSNRKYRFTPDQLFVIKHAGADDPLELVGRPDCIMFRMQEESSGLVGNKEQMLSPERVLLTGRFKMGEETHLVTADFGLDNVGAADVPQTVTIDTVNFARTALHLNGETDLVTLPADVSAISDTMTFSAWVRHNEGEGTLVKRGDPETNGFAIEWRPGEKTLVALLSGTVATGDSSEAADDGSGAPDDATRTDDAAALAPGIELKAPLPTSHTWHHIALVVDTEGAALYIDGEEVSHTDGAVTGFTTGGETVIGGPSQADPEKSWLDFEIDQTHNISCLAPMPPRLIWPFSWAFIPTVPLINPIVTRVNRFCGSL